MGSVWVLFLTLLYSRQTILYGLQVHEVVIPHLHTAPVRAPHCPRSLQCHQHRSPGPQRCACDIPPLPRPSPLWRPTVCSAQLRVSLSCVLSLARFQIPAPSEVTARVSFSAPLPSAFCRLLLGSETVLGATAVLSWLSEAFYEAHGFSS